MVGKQVRLFLVDGSAGGLMTAAKDVAYSSPSAAAAVVHGRASSNGRIEWISDAGQTYGAWEASQVEV